MVGSDIFIKLTALTTMSLCGNYLDEIPVVDLPHLQSLSLCRNNFTHISGTVLPPSLLSLDLSNNTRLASMAGLNGSSLLALDLSYSALSALPPTVFRGLSSLGSLDLSGTKTLKTLDGIQDALATLTALTTLSLAGCALERLPAGTFRTNMRLSSLDLSYNCMVDIAVGALDGTQVWQRIHPLQRCSVAITQIIVTLLLPLPPLSPPLPNSSNHTRTHATILKTPNKHSTNICISSHYWPLRRSNV